MTTTNTNVGALPAKAVIILSGGLDSATCAYIAQAKGYEIYPLTFLYGQRHIVEIECAKKIAAALGVTERHRFIELPLPKGTALVAANNMDVPEDRNLEEMSKVIPLTYVPARNTIFMAFALQYAEEINADAIYIGANAIDYSGYPDTRPEYIRKWQELIDLATKKTVEGGKITIETPILQMYKSEIVDWGTELGVPYEHTHSCYHPTEGNLSCGHCDSCKLRLKGWREAGKTDPLIYASRLESASLINPSLEHTGAFILNNGEDRGTAQWDTIDNPTHTVQVRWSDGAVTRESLFFLDAVQRPIEG